MICKNCGAKIKDTAKFCNMCGTSVAPENKSCAESVSSPILEYSDRTDKAFLYMDRIVYEHVNRFPQDIKLSDIKRAYISVGNFCVENNDGDEVILGVFDRYYMNLFKNCINAIKNGTFTSVEEIKAHTPKKSKIETALKVIIPIIIIAFLADSCFGSNDNRGATTTVRPKTSDVQETKIEYITATVNELQDERIANLLRANEKYVGKYIELTGEFESVDVNGTYFELVELNAILGLSVKCYIKNDEQKSIVMDMSKGHVYTVRCRIISLEDWGGYKADVIEIL